MKKVLGVLLVSFVSLCSFANSASESKPMEIWVKINGIEQFLSIQQADDDLPLLLYLHGGPGESVMQQKNNLTGELNDEFIVVHWDQRGAGETLKKNALSPTVDLQMMKRDAEAVTDYLLKRFNREKLYIVAHSWGTVLGFHLAKIMPEKISLYTAISPIVNPKKSQSLALEQLKRHFKDNPTAMADLSAISIPVSNLKDMIAQYRWTSEMSGRKVTDEQVAQAMPFFKDWEKKWMSIQRELNAVDLNTQLSQINCPVQIFVGTEDIQTHFQVTDDYYQQLNSPAKKLLWFDGAGHNLPASHAKQMQQALKASK